MVMQPPLLLEGVVRQATKLPLAFKTSKRQLTDQAPSKADQPLS